ncbi:LytR/AlgR family response regulator transcription factor [Periweissella cryptocerci]|nr:LytTR family DNA-binding domain-containing protein [Periweissella cryptocerci]
MNIYVVDDQLATATQIGQLAKEIKRAQKITNCVVEVFTKLADFTAAVHNHSGENNVYFIDVDVHGVKLRGLEVASKLRQHDPFGTISFISSFEKFAPVTFEYRVAAFDYIDKRLPVDELRQRLAYTINYQAKRSAQITPAENLVLDGKAQQHKVPFDKILYIETTPVPHQLRLVTDDGVVEFYGKLSELAEQNTELVRCHRACLVNPAKISAFNKTEHLLEVSNGETLPVARNMMKTMTERF